MVVGLHVTSPSLSTSVRPGLPVHLGGPTIGSVGGCCLCGLWWLFAALLFFSELSFPVRGLIARDQMTGCCTALCTPWSGRQPLHILGDSDWFASGTPEPMNGTATCSPGISTLLTTNNGDCLSGLTCCLLCLGVHTTQTEGPGCPSTPPLPLKENPAFAEMPPFQAATAADGQLATSVPFRDHTADPDAGSSLYLHPVQGQASTTVPTPTLGFGQMGHVDVVDNMASSVPPCLGDHLSDPQDGSSRGLLSVPVQVSTTAPIPTLGFGQMCHADVVDNMASSVPPCLGDHLADPQDGSSRGLRSVPVQVSVIASNPFPGLGLGDQSDVVDSSSSTLMRCPALVGDQLRDFLTQAVVRGITSAVAGAPSNVQAILEPLLKFKNANHFVHTPSGPGYSCRQGDERRFSPTDPSWEFWS